MSTNKTITICLISLLLLASLYYTVYHWAIPKTAAWNIPYKWKNLPVNQPRNLVLEYMGNPASTGLPLIDRWYKGTYKRNYCLTVYYSKDSTMTAASIAFQHESWLGTKRYVLDSISAQ